ncbi:hypothetical protein LCGC14_1548270 [marine sediment metagenome]|uniref:Uncharacterized protein n=1 Tax=marine sediment metagenome TaxID=412755 RepID=A0A0F9IR31_9ZZZZ
MGSFWIDWRSFFKGITRMKYPHEKVNYSLSIIKRPGFWIHLWTPKWHDGRGPYITIGLGYIRFIRGY